MTLENKPSIEQDHSQIEETIADQEDFTTVYIPPEKRIVDEKTKKEIEDLHAELTFRQSKTNQKDIPEALDKRMPGDEPWEAPVQNSVREKAPHRIRNWLMGAATLFGFAKAASGENSIPHMSSTEDSLKNKIESVAKNSATKDSLKTVSPEKNLESEAFSDQLRKDWNDYQSWLQSIDMAGNAALDKNDLGGKLIDRYRKEHPHTLVSRETVDDIQKEFARYREWVLAQVKAGKAQLTEGTTEEKFMEKLSIIDGIPGQLTTSHRFPDAYLKTFENGKLVKTEHQGFAKTGKTISYNEVAKNK